MPSSPFRPACLIMLRTSSPSAVRANLVTVELLGGANDTSTVISISAQAMYSSGCGPVIGSSAHAGGGIRPFGTVNWIVNVIGLRTSCPWTVCLNPPKLSRPSELGSMPSVAWPVSRICFKNAMAWNTLLFPPLLRPKKSVKGAKSMRWRGPKPLKFSISIAVSMVPVALCAAGWSVLGSSIRRHCDASPRS